MENDILAAIGAEKAPILIKLSEYEGRHSLELRRYYYDVSSRGLRPTQKGINLNREAFAILRNILHQQGEAIDGWLRADSDATARAHGWTLSDRAQAMSESRTSARPHIAEAASWRSTTFFEVRAEGGSDRITYNEAHAFALTLDALLANLEDPTGRRTAVGGLRELIRLMLIAYYRSRMLFEGAEQ